jgi:hypothetical protein
MIAMCIVDAQTMCTAVHKICEQLSCQAAGQHDATCVSVNDGNLAFKIVDFIVSAASNAHGHHGRKCPADRYGAD